MLEETLFTKAPHNTYWLSPFLYLFYRIPFISNHREDFICFWNMKVKSQVYQQTTYGVLKPFFMLDLKTMIF